MGDTDKQQRHDQQHGTSEDAQHDAAVPHPEHAGAPGAGYLGNDARVASSTTAVTGFNDPTQQTYAHGAMMGAAGAFMKDPLWNQIFRALSPDEHDRIARIPAIRDVMLALENNPVLAAYGECRTLESRGEAAGRADPHQQKVLPQEWDVWLDKEDPGNLDKVKIAHGSLMTTILQSATESQKDKVIGYGRDDVRGAKSSNQWMETFGKAVAMYRGGAAADHSAATGDRQAAMQRAASATNAAAAIDIAVEFLKKENGGGLVLDVKSTYSSANDINHFIDVLKAKGVNVIGVGTFRHSQLDGLEAGVRPVKFYHGITGVNNAARDGSLHKGDHVMFNAGSLLDQSGGWVRDVSFGINQAAFQQLSALVSQFELNVGLYVQEGDVDRKAVEVIMRMVNRFPHLFKDGFAYGNLSGSAETETHGSGMGSQANTDRLDQGRAIPGQVRDMGESLRDKLPW
jgi:hypothetical protein